MKRTRQGGGKVQEIVTANIASFKMTAKQLVWSAHRREICKVAKTLQEEAVQVDVYLHTAQEGGDGLANKSGDSIAASVLCKRKKFHRDSRSFPAHKLILAAASPFLEKVLTEHYHEHHETCIDITIPHVLPDALRCILDFLYCGSVKVPLAIKERVLEAANLLQIKNFADYYHSTAKLEGVCKHEKRTLEEACDSLNKVIQIPHQKRGRKKNGTEVHDAFSDLSAVTSQIKEEGEAGVQPECSSSSAAGRCRRKVKSRYSADIYEVNLPKVRRWKKKRLTESLKAEKEATPQSLKEPQQPLVPEEPYLYAVHNDISSISNTHPESQQCVFRGMENKAQRDYICVPPSSNCTMFAQKSKTNGNLESPLPVLPLVPAPPSPSIITPQIFAADPHYLQDSTVVKSESLESVLEQHDPTVRNRSSESPTMAVAPLPSSTLLPDVKGLPLISSHASVESFPIKPVTSIAHQEKNEDGEQEDGLFKFQVLLKECENFPGEVCPSQSPERTRENSVAEKYHRGDGSINISQWISEEIQSCMVPTTGNEDKVSGQSEAEVMKDGERASCKEHCATEESKSSDFNTNKNKRDFECEKCGKKFMDLHSCQSHIRGVHNEARQMCKYCGKMFKRRCDLYQHERRHRTASLPCKFCEKSFKVAKDLRAHMATHVGGKRFHCSYCNKELTSFRNLRNHISSIHQKQRPFTCQICKKTYSKSCSLQVHMRSVHTGERPFKCGVCGKCFCNSALLKNHQVVHTGERKYCCRVCGRPFSQYSNMISHQRVHTNERPHSCSVCKENFKTKEGLLKHKWIHTGLKPLRCHHCCKEFRIKESYERHMLRCHNETVSLPKIFFEVSEGESAGNPPTCDEQVIQSIEKASKGKMLEGSIIEKSTEDDLSPVVHFVSNMAEEQVPDSDSGHVQLSYPLLTSATGLEENDNMTLGNITSQIDVESLLSDGDTPASDVLMMTGERKSEMLSASIHDGSTRDCEEVVILTKVSEDNEDLTANIHPPPTIKIWIPSERPVAEGQNSEEGNILIVSNQALAETGQALPVLDSELVSPVVHTMILNNSNSSM